LRIDIHQSEILLDGDEMKGVELIIFELEYFGESDGAKSITGIIKVYS
jgi:hypothetical protein